MTLEPLPDDWSRALCVVAHPDDMEYGGAAAVARWTSEGKDVRYLLLTRGEAGIDSMEPAESARVREAEQRASAAVVGVDVVDFLDHPDGVLTYSVELRRDIAAAIRRHRPELVIASNYHQTWPGGMLNMADHRVCGLATIDAARDAGNRWVFTELAEQGLEPWSDVRYLAALSSPQSTNAVDVTETFALGVESLRCHAAYLEALGGPDPEEFLRGSAEAAGEQLGVELAVPFELLRL